MTPGPKSLGGRQRLKKVPTPCTYRYKNLCFRGRTDEVMVTFTKEVEEDPGLM